MCLVALYVGLGEYVLWRNGEIRPIRSIVKEQLSTDRDSHFAKSLTRSHPLYLLEHLRQRKAKIIVLGQSITHQFQARMFHPYEDDFFNASNVFQTLEDLELVISEIESGIIHKPELIIWGIDPDYLKIQEHQKPNFALGTDDPVAKLDDHLRVMQIIWKNTLHGRFDYWQRTKDPVGYGIAGSQGIGRRKDGSHDNTPIHEQYRLDPVYKERNDFKNKLDKKLPPFGLPLELDKGLIDKFLELVSRVDQLDIEIIFYGQQFSDDFMSHAMQDDLFVPFWQSFTKICDSLKKEGYAMISPGTPSMIGLDDRYMRDANHAAEVMTAMQLFRMNNLILKRLNSPDFKYSLESLLSSRQTEQEL